MTGQVCAMEYSLTLIIMIQELLSVFHILFTLAIKKKQQQKTIDFYPPFSFQRFAETVNSPSVHGTCHWAFFHELASLQCFTH